MSVKEITFSETNISADALANNLSALISRHNLSESDLAKALNIPYNSIHRLIEGTTTDPRMSTLVMIADYFEITVDQLIRPYILNQPHQITSEIPKFVPIFSWENLQSKNFFDSVDLANWENWQPVAIPKSQKLGANAYGLESRRSMHPRFPLGTIFVIDPDEQPIDGDLVLVNTKDKGEITLRELIIDAPHWRLIPTVVGSETLILDSKLYEITGVVVLTMFHARSS